MLPSVIRVIVLNLADAYSGSRSYNLHQLQLAAWPSKGAGRLFCYHRQWPRVRVVIRLALQPMDAMTNHSCRDVTRTDLQKDSVNMSSLWRSDWRIFIDLAIHDGLHFLSISIQMYLRCCPSQLLCDLLSRQERSWTLLHPAKSAAWCYQG